MTERSFLHQVQVYYEDTDFSGVVYHANYLKYFERAREHAIGSAVLARMFADDGLGFVVYKVELTFSDGAVFADLLDIRSTYELEGPYRMNWTQEAWRPDGKRPAVKGVVQLVCVNRDRQLVPIPQEYLPTTG